MDAAHIYIYGYFNEDLLKSVRAQIAANQAATKFIEHYDSAGGYVEIGKKIKDELIATGKDRIAIAEGKLMSIATIPFLSAPYRKAKKSIGDKKLMIHNPWGKPEGDADKMEMAAKILRDMEDYMSTDYEKATHLSKEEALALMKKETYLSLEKALEIGFIHEVTEEEEFKAVALFNENKNQNNTMTEKRAEELNESLSGLQKLINKMMKAFKPKALVVQDANGTEIDFYELGEEETPAVGDKATIDGSPADGEYTMPEGDVFVFSSGEVSEINPAAESEEEEEESEEIQALKKEKEQLEEEVKNLKASKETLEEENTKLKEDKESFQAMATETETKFKALQEAFTGAGLDVDQPEGKKEEGAGEGKVRQLFKKGA